MSGSRSERILIFHIYLTCGLNLGLSLNLYQVLNLCQTPENAWIAVVNISINFT